MDLAVIPDGSLPQLNGRTAEFIDILRGIREGLAVKDACEQVGVPRQTFYDWVEKDPQATSMYAQARERQADAHADKIVAAADATIRGELDPQAARVAIDAYKWTASKLRPQAYGERLEHRMTADSSFIEALDIIEKRRAPKTIEVIDNKEE